MSIPALRLFQLPRDGAYELRACGAKGAGIFASKQFCVGDLVIPGQIVARAERNDSYANQVGPAEFVYEGALKAFVNHCCEPNCGVRQNTWGALDLIARRAIAVGEEVTVDYAMHSYVVEYFPPRCLCGSKLCRGEVTGWSGLSPAGKMAYSDHAAPFLLEIDRKLKKALSRIHATSNMAMPQHAL